MAKIFSMQPLVHLAHQKNDEATRKFGQLIQQHQAAQAKLRTLEQYREDYQTRLQQAVQKGIDQINLRNFQASSAVWTRQLHNNAMPLNK